MIIKTMGVVKYDKLDEIIIYILFLGYVVDLGGQLGIRAVLVYPSLIYLLFRSIYNFRDKFNNIFFLFILLVFYPGIVAIIGFFHGANFKLLNSQWGATIQMFILFIALKRISGKKLLNILVNVLFIAQLFSLILYLSILLHVPLSRYILGYLGAKFNGGYFGYLLVGNTTTPIIYFKSTLLGTFTSIFFFSKKKYIKSGISFISLFVGLTKAGIFFSVIGLLAIFFIRSKKLDYLFLLLFFIIVFYGASNYISLFSHLQGSHTLSVRIEQYNWFKNWIYNEPLQFIFGKGLGTSISLPYGKVYNIELAYLDLIRKYGVLYFIIILGIFFKIIIKIIPQDLGVGIGLILTSFAVGTNPLLVTSIFFILVYSISKISYET